jgi:hypothetical protein
MRLVQELPVREHMHEELNNKVRMVRMQLAEAPAQGRYLTGKHP